MSYTVDLVDCHVALRAPYKDADGQARVLQHLKTTMYDPTFLQQHAQGLSWTKESTAAKVYRYTNTARVLATRTLAAFIGQFVDSAEYLESGELYLLHNNALGDQHVLFAVLAPFLEDDCFLEWRGEDNYAFQWRVVDGALYDFAGVIEWKHPTPFMAVPPAPPLHDGMTQQLCAILLP